jgi:hypothetical protein
MAKPSTTKTVTLDWSKLLGFDQAPRGTAKSGARLADPRLVKLGNKAGTKQGNKPTRSA